MSGSRIYVAGHDGIPGAAHSQAYLATAKAFIGMVKELTNLVVGACRNTQPHAKFIRPLAVEFNPR